MLLYKFNANAAFGQVLNETPQIIKITRQAIHAMNDHGIPFPNNDSLQGFSPKMRTSLAASKFLLFHFLAFPALLYYTAVANQPIGLLRRVSCQ